MTKTASDAPFSHLVSVQNWPDKGKVFQFEATPEQCSAIAKDFKLPAIHSLSVYLTLTGSQERTLAKGTVKASVEQTCVVSLEPFGTQIEEKVDLVFVTPEKAALFEADETSDTEEPGLIVNNQIDLGAVATEFLALGLDPYPRKPDAVFYSTESEDVPPSPFTVLTGLKQKE